MRTQHWLKVSTLKWQKATRKQFIEAERGAGFYPKSGNGTATAGFSGGGIEGKLTILPTKHRKATRLRR